MTTSEIQIETVRISMVRIIEGNEYEDLDTEVVKLCWLELEQSRG